MERLTKSIFNIKEDYIKTLVLLDEAEGELTPEIEQALYISEAELQIKSVAYAYKINEYLAITEVAQREIDRITKIKEQAEKKAEYLKKTVSDAMQLFNCEKIELDLVKLSFRKSEAVEILDQTQIPKEYMIEKYTYSPDKKMLKEAIKKGDVISGCKLVEKQNLQIK